MKRRVCVIIPAYNEAAVIHNVIKKSLKVFKKSPYSIDIIVVNDGSKDSTSIEARKAGAFVIDHILNSGAGGATATGLAYAARSSYEAAATMDADGQHDPSDVVRGFDELFKNKADLLIGSRLIDGANMSSTKRLGNWGLSTITQILFGVKSTDSQSGLRLFSPLALEKLRWSTNGYEFCSEMLWRAKQNNLDIAEYPIRTIYTDYSKAKGQNNWNAINIVKRLLKRRIAELLG
jgi:UDP-N-acetylglucosamine---dolichyl-phosphate N-acetylglucosaminyltransferase